MTIVRPEVLERQYPHIDLGAGFTKRGDECITIDISANSSADIIMDIGKEILPFPNDSVEMIDCHQTIEHLDGEQRIFMMNEAYRVLKPKRTMYITCPYHDTKEATFDPTHKFPPLCEISFDYFSNKEFMEYLQDLYNITARFKIIKCKRGKSVDSWQLFTELSK